MSVQDIKRMRDLLVQRVEIVETALLVVDDIVNLENYEQQLREEVGRLSDARSVLELDVDRMERRALAAEARRDEALVELEAVRRRAEVDGEKIVKEAVERSRQAEVDAQVRVDHMRNTVQVKETKLRESIAVKEARVAALNAEIAELQAEVERLIRTVRNA